MPFIFRDTVVECLRTSLDFVVVVVCSLVTLANDFSYQNTQNGLLTKKYKSNYYCAKD